MIGFVRTGNWNIEILGLNIGEGREFYIELLQVGPSNLFIELLGEHAV